MKVSVDAGLCRGHGRCLAIAPDLFDLDDDGFAFVLGDGTVPADREQDAELAVDNCPEEAVSLVRD